MPDRDPRPNVLMFIPHDLGEHLHCYGHASVKSPNLDRLAGEGVRFSNFFTASPECTPSRAGLYTGQYMHQNGLMGLCHRGWEFSPDAVHLAQYLRDAGYHTCLFGTQHETGGSPERLGYQKAFAPRPVRSCFDICDAAAQWIDREAPNVPGPWFACVGFQDTHRPWRPAKDFGPDDVEVPPYLPDAPEVRADLAELHQSILDMDTAIGGVLEALGRGPAADNTIVAYTADHGIPFPRAKATFFDPGIHVPLIVRRPGEAQSGRVCDELISNLDYTPTILEMCGVDVPEELEGRSFLSLMNGDAYEESEAVFGTLYYDAFYDPIHTVRTRTHKYVRSYGVTPEDAAGADPEVLAKHEPGSWIRADDSDVQRSPTWEVIRRDGPFPKPPPEELYDLVADPLERKNVVDDPAYADTLAGLRARLREMMERTNSPLLTGHVSPDLSSTRNGPVGRK